MDNPEITQYRPTEDTGREVGNSVLVKRLQRGVPAFLSLTPHKRSVVPPKLSSMHLKDTQPGISLIVRQHRGHLGNPNLLQVSTPAPPCYPASPHTLPLVGKAASSS